MVTGQAPASAAARLREAFASGRFVFTAELDSPSHASTTQIERQARGYAPYVDAINCTDNAGAVVRMCPVAARSPPGRTRWSLPRG